MSLETATYISGLNAANPPSGDPVANAADHIRLIKQVLLDTFPNIGAAAVTSTAAQLSSGVVPTGGIIDWSGSVSAIPTGWGLCNGSTYSKVDGSGSITSPDLRNKFIVGAGSTYAVGATGGAVSHSHNLNIAGTSLTIDQLPNLPVSIYDPGHSHGVSDPGHSHGINGNFYGPGGHSVTAYTSSGVGPSWSNPATNGSGTGISIQGSGTGIWASINGPAGNAHGHGGSTSDWQSNLPPYYALAKIIKL